MLLFIGWRLKVLVDKKIVIIGAGAQWTTVTVGDLIHTRDLWGSTISLVDINAERLAVMTKIVKRMFAEAKANFNVESTLNRREALENADFVISGIAVGSHYLEDWKKDVEISIKHHIYPGVGDTVGPSGFSRALRSIPVVVEFGRDMEELCPKALFINYTNPMTTIC